MKTVYLRHEPIELFKILKFEGLVGSGAEAKLAVAEGLVTLNGVTELQKRKKIKSGDKIGFNGEIFCLAMQQ